jgi:hypothetical protein
MSVGTLNSQFFPHAAAPTVATSPISITRFSPPFPLTLTLHLRVVVVALRFTLTRPTTVALPLVADILTTLLSISPRKCLTLAVRSSRLLLPTSEAPFPRCTLHVSIYLFISSVPLSVADAFALSSDVLAPLFPFSLILPSLHRYRFRRPSSSHRRCPLSSSI